MDISQVSRTGQPAKKLSHQDLEYEVGALASRHGLSVVQARAIIDRCGADIECIDAEARRLRAN